MASIREPSAPYGGTMRALTGGRRRPAKQVFSVDLLPANPQAEAYVIGGVLDWAANAEIASLLEPSDFYEPVHQLIWQAVCDLAERGEALTSVAVTALLFTRGELAGVGGQAYLSTLQTRAEIANTRQYARIVFDRARERHIGLIGAELTRLAMAAPEDMPGVLAYHRAQLADWEERALAFEPSAKRTPGVLASEVQPRAIDWLWRRRIAYGKLALLDGDPGLGKGLIGVDLAARLTTGTPLPDDMLDPRRRAPQNVLLITPEDDPDDTIVPRLIAADADLSRVRILTALPTETVNGVAGERPLALPRDTVVLERVIAEHEASFIIIDPIMGVLDTEYEAKSDQAVRAALMPLKLMVERLRVACLLVRHLNKSGGDKALYRGGGSIAFTGLCRTTLLIAEHPEDRNQRVLAGVKTNIGRLPDSLAFSVVTDEGDEHPRLSWSRDVVTYDANSLLGASKSDERMEIVRVLKLNAPNEMTPHEIALALGVPADKESRIRRLLTKLQQAGDIRNPAYGRYAL